MQDQDRDIHRLHGEDALSSLRSRRVYVKTFGCTHNVADTQKLCEVLRHQGCTIEADPAAADAIVVNTCTVIEATERKVLKTLRAFAGRPLYVTGCMPAVQMEAVAASCNPVVIDPGDIEDAYRRVRSVPPGPVAIIQVGQGCLGACTYCITRRARGRLTSYPRGEILARVAASACRGAVEIRLTGQDLGAWGRDCGSDLASLLGGISGIRGDFQVRVGMMNPVTLLPIVDRVVDAFRHPKVFSFLHLPIQSGSDRILRFMGRGYRVEDAEAIIAAFRRAIPEVCLTTDLICGFPGETEEDFEESLGLVSRIRPDKVNITRYSARPGTPAARMKGMPDRFRKDRSRRLLAHAGTILGQVNAPWVGRVVPVTVTEHIRAGSSMARTHEYRAVVLARELVPGFRGAARITAHRGYYFTGDLVGPHC